jgi:predicted peptidase
VRRIVLLGLVLFAATVAAAAASSGGLPNIGKAKMTAEPVYRGFYDHHIDTYLITDVSSKSQAAALHVNYSAELKASKGLPEQYFVVGRAAKGQLTIFGSQPGEADYNPLWEEVFLTWKKGVKPVLIGQDDQIDALEKKGKLTEKDAHIVLNAPILKVGKGG